MLISKKVKELEGLFGIKGCVFWRSKVVVGEKQINFDFSLLIFAFEQISYLANIFLNWDQSELSRAITVSSAKALAFRNLLFKDSPLIEELIFLRKGSIEIV